MESTPRGKDSLLKNERRCAPMGQPGIWTAIREILDVWPHRIILWTNRFRLLDGPPPPSCSDNASKWYHLSEPEHASHTTTSGISSRRDSWYGDQHDLSITRPITVKGPYTNQKWMRPLQGPGRGLLAGEGFPWRLVLADQKTRDDWTTGDDRDYRGWLIDPYVKVVPQDNWQGMEKTCTAEPSNAKMPTDLSPEGGIELTWARARNS